VNVRTLGAAQADVLDAADWYDQQRRVWARAS